MIYPNPFIAVVAIYLLVIKAKSLIVMVLLVSSGASYKLFRFYPPVFEDAFFNQEFDTSIKALQL